MIENVYKVLNSALIKMISDVQIYFLK